MKICIVDDHELIQAGTVTAIKHKYPEAEILTANSVNTAKALLERVTPDLLITDLSLPQAIGMPAHIDQGLGLLEYVMRQYPNTNIVVQSSYVKALVRIKTLIFDYGSGFAVVDKSQSTEELLTNMAWALKGRFNTPIEIRNGIELKPEWETLLRLAFVEGLQDKAIGERMNIAESTVRKYWTRIQDMLNVYPEEGKNIRIQTELRSREEGLLD
jgi:DNA-binding NarL/FixJ family response regulator